MTLPSALVLARDAILPWVEDPLGYDQLTPQIQNDRCRAMAAALRWAYSEGRIGNDVLEIIAALDREGAPLKE